MINHLVWGGIDEAESLLGAPQREPAEPGGVDENRPLERASVDELMRVSNRGIPRRRQEPHRGRDRPRHRAVGERRQERRSWSRRWRTSARRSPRLPTPSNGSSGWASVTRSCHARCSSARGASLVRRFLTDDLEYINTAKNYLHVHDFCDIVAARRVAGRLRAASWAARAPAFSSLSHRAAVRRSNADAIGAFKMPKTWYITSRRPPGVPRHNHLQDIQTEVPRGRAGPPSEYPHIVQAFKNSRAPEAGPEGASRWPSTDIGDKRSSSVSSSLLEDRTDPAFCGNVTRPLPGEPREQARPSGRRRRRVAEVYAALQRPGPHRVAVRTRWAAQRGLLDLHERRWGS